MLEGGWAQAGGLPDSPGLCCGVGPGGSAALAKFGPPASGSADTASGGLGRWLSLGRCGCGPGPGPGPGPCHRGLRRAASLGAAPSQKPRRGQGRGASWQPLPVPCPLPACWLCLPGPLSTTRPGQLHTRRPVCRLLFCLLRTGRPWALSMGVCEPGSQGSGVTLGLRGGPLGARGSPADLTRARV